MKPRPNSSILSSIASSTAAGAALWLLVSACASSQPSGVGLEPAQIAPGVLEAIDWSSVTSQRPPHVRVLPLDTSGGLVRARVAVIRENASNSITSSGPVAVTGATSDPATLTLTTEDGHIAWRTITPEDRGPMAVAVDQPGAFLDVELARDEATRIAVFFGDVRIHDYTLRPGKRSTFVVPAGDVRFGLTGPNEATQTVSFEAGEREFVRLK